MRICCLIPSATEIAFALELGENVVGVTHECDYPEEARQKSIVVRSLIDSNQMTSKEIDLWVGERLQGKQSLYEIDQSRLREAAPDVILTQGLCDVCAIDENEVLAAAKALPSQPKIISLTPHCLTDVLNDVMRVAEATGSRQQGETLVRSLKQRIDSIRSRASQASSEPRVACFEWFDPIYAAGHWVPEMVELAGGRDALARKGEPSASVEWSTVKEARPDIIVLMPCGFEIKRTIQESTRLPTLAGWNQLPAVKGRNVYAVNSNAFFSRPGPRLVDGLEILAQIIHPEIFFHPMPTDAVQRLF
jgi:iron complex transport system substrate-binding protein